MKASKSIEIAAPPGAVWPYFVDPEKVLGWCITFKKYEYSGAQQGGVGTPLYIEEDAGTGLTKMNFEVTGWKENERVDLHMLSGGNYKRYEQHWWLEAVPGGSRFTFSEEIDLPYGALGKLIGLFAERMSARTLDKMLPRLKSMAEA